MKAVVHIGADKAGSSAIQSWSAIHRNTLVNRSVYYPESTDGPDWAAQRGLTSGTGRTLQASLVELEKTISVAQSKNCDFILFSSESFLRTLGTPSSLERLRVIQDIFGIEVEVYGLVRDPLIYLQSVYNQNVKTGMYTDTFSNFILKWNSHLERMPTITLLPKLVSVLRRSGLSVNIRPYSNYKSNLIPGFYRWCFGIELDSDVTKLRSVNQSLNHSVLEIIRGMNSILPRIGAHLGFELAATNPSLFECSGRTQKYCLTQEAGHVLRNLIGSFQSEMEGVSLNEFTLDYALQNDLLCVHCVGNCGSDQDLYEFGRGLAKSIDHGFLKWGYERNFE